MKEIKEPWDLIKVSALARKIGVGWRSNMLPAKAQQMKKEFNEANKEFWDKWVEKKEGFKIFRGLKMFIRNKKLL